MANPSAPPSTANTTASAASTHSKTQSTNFPSTTATTTTTTTTSAATIPPSLNVYKTIAVVRHTDDNLQYEDAVTGKLKTVSIQALGDAIATTTPLVQARPKQDIPVPRINTVQSYRYDVPADYRAPNYYVRYQRLTPEEWMHNMIEYVADKDDEQWLRNNAKLGGTVTLAAEEHPASQFNLAQRPQLTLDLFERIFDLLEKATGFNSIITFQHFETLLSTKLPHLTVYFLDKTGRLVARPFTAVMKTPTFEPTVGGSAITGFIAPEGALPTKDPATVASTPTSAAIMIATKQVLHDVYQYWVQKRSRLKRPLLRPYWPVTSTDDTNPHLVFRPREKEKYKLRKKRQNDMDAFLKLKQLRSDFDSLRAVLDLVRKRQEWHLVHCKLQLELFQQRLYDIVDTSGESRLVVSENDEECNSIQQEVYSLAGIIVNNSVSDSALLSSGDVINKHDTSWNTTNIRIPICRAAMKRARENLPLYFDIHGRKAKRVRQQSNTASAIDMNLNGTVGRSLLGTATTSTTSIASGRAESFMMVPGNLSGSSGLPVGTLTGVASGTTITNHPNGVFSASGNQLNVAGRNHGEPAPNFLHPLATRESYVSSWDHAVPHLPAYVNSHAQPTTYFRHRPRIGRGGRLCIDRMPLPNQSFTDSMTPDRNKKIDTRNSYDENTTPHSVFIAGRGLPHYLKIKERLLDLLPEPLDHPALSRRLEELSIAAIKEDLETRASMTTSVPATTTIPGNVASDPDENDGEEMLVKASDWLDTDEQYWGEERYFIGPI